MAKLKADNEQLREQWNSDVERLKGQLTSLRVESDEKQQTVPPGECIFYNGNDVTEEEKSENVRLKELVASLEKEIERIKDSTHEQRIRALDLKHELREVHFGFVSS